MIGIIRGLFALVPAPMKIWVSLLGAALIAGMITAFIWKIDNNGYRRCEMRYSDTALKLNEKARGEILKVEKRYENIRREIDRKEGADDPVGYRVELAIDRMPSPPSGE